jgi:hypothetical protein
MSTDGIIDHMADTPDDIDSPDQTAALRETPIYTLPGPLSERRANERHSWLTQRADLVSGLLALIPPEAHADAMSLVLLIEQIHAREDAALTRSWLQEVQTAYLHGRAEMATEQLEAITGETEVPRTGCGLPAYGADRVH